MCFTEVWAYLTNGRDFDWEGFYNPDDWYDRGKSEKNMVSFITFRVELI